MNWLSFSNMDRSKQYFFSVGLICFVSALCYLFSPYLGYKVIAFILMVAVSLIAMTFDILPVFVAAIISALIWDFFFIPPRFTLHISSTEDTILLVTYFLIALVNAVLTYKIRKIEKRAKQKEEKANTVKLYNTLLNSLSHELRTPIATIIGATDNLQINNDNLSERNKYDLINEISKASMRLNQQVENLLNMSRLESGFVQPKSDWCDINEIIYNVIKRIEETKVPQKITINVNPEIPLFKLDKGMLEQIIYNLINNAVLYTEPDRKINIVATNYTNVLEIIVEDNGNGFPEKEMKNVFDKFYRLKNTKAGGTGLGLSIVKGFTEAMGGSVRLENLSTGGAKFTIQIAAKTSQFKTEKWIKREY
ncbi:MAG TPA: ATP-binding protein [Flavitalea sp.]|nr:ATP-binding protein [Flavitalea sp.]